MSNVLLWSEKTENEAEGKGFVPACGSCAHWAKLPADPNNLGAPKTGECREGPPQNLAVPTGFDTRTGTLMVSVVTQYARTGEDFPACRAYRGVPQVVKLYPEDVHEEASDGF